MTTDPDQRSVRRTRRVRRTAIALWVLAGVAAVGAVLFVGVFEDVPGVVTTGLSLVASGAVIAGIIVWGRADPVYDPRTFDDDSDSPAG